MVNDSRPTPLEDPSAVRGGVRFLSLRKWKSRPPRDWIGKGKGQSYIQLSTYGQHGIEDPVLTTTPPRASYRLRREGLRSVSGAVVQAHM